MKTGRFVWAALAAFVVFSACDKKPDSQNGAIRIGSRWITNEEIGEIAQVFSRGRAGDIFEGMDTAMVRQAAKQLVAHYLMYQEAEKRGLTADSARLESVFKAFRQRFPDEAAYQRALTATGESEETIRAQMKEQLLVDELVKQTLQEIDSVSDSTCMAYYENNKDRFASKKKYRLSQVFFSLPDGISDEEQDSVRAEADKALYEVKNGKEFSAVAREYSQGPESKDGGDLGWFAEGDLSPVFDNAAKTLSKGEVSEVVKSGIGLHIVRKDDEKLVEAQPYDSVKQEIALTLEVRQRNERVKTFIDSLAEEASIQYADATYEDLFQTP